MDDEGTRKSIKYKTQTLHLVILKPDHTDENVAKYRAHGNIYNVLKRSAKLNYYQEKCKLYRQNTKKLWGLINETIKKPSIKVA